MEDISEIKKMNEKKEKRNMEQLESVMESIANYFRKAMKAASMKNQNSFELNINLEFKDTFDPRYMQQFQKTKAYEKLVEECRVNDVKMVMKLKDTNVLFIKGKW